MAGVVEGRGTHRGLSDLSTASTNSCTTSFTTRRHPAWSDDRLRRPRAHSILGSRIGTPGFAGLRGAMFDRYDPRDAVGRHLALPRGSAGELVRDPKRSYDLNGQEPEALATIGAFRVVHADDLRD